MQSIDTAMIQPGWKVIASDGEEIGTVVDAVGDSLKVKKSGLMGGEYQVPRSSVTEVETGRVEIGLSKKDLDSGATG